MGRWNTASAMSTAVQQTTATSNENSRRSLSEFKTFFALEFRLYLAAMEPLRSLYPEIEPYDSGHIRVSAVHELYYEQCGNPSGKPVVFLHGGPGAGLVPDYRRFFDPETYRIVLFDKRGAGRSKPHASLDDNTTWHLVSDIEQIREHFVIDKWLGFGGSGGSTLALDYAATHPDRVRGLVLRGIFLCRPKEIRWFYE